MPRCMPRFMPRRHAQAHAATHDETHAETNRRTEQPTRKPRSVHIGAAPSRGEFVRSYAGAADDYADLAAHVGAADDYVGSSDDRRGLVPMGVPSALTQRTPPGEIVAR